MKNAILFTALLAGFLLSASCSIQQNLEPFEFQPGQSFELGYNDSSRCNCGDLSITLTDVVEDTYSPAWNTELVEAQSRAQLEVRTDNVSQAIELVFRSTRSSFGQDTVGNYIISLMQVSPSPSIGQEADKQSYRVKLMVQELQ